MAVVAPAQLMGWRMFLSTGRYMDPADDPTLATLRGNPRFERINRLVKAQGKGTDRVSCLHEPAFMTRKLEDPEKLISWRLSYLMSVFGRKQALR
jgi:hypothetical protein